MVTINVALLIVFIGVALVTLYCFAKLAIIVLNVVYRLIFGHLLFWVVMMLLLMTGVGIPLVIILVILHFRSVPVKK